MIYELLYIIPNKYSEVEVKEIHSKILELAKKNEFKITHEENLGIKKFAYPIKHSYYGYYLVIQFTLEEKAKLSLFKQKMAILPEVLRSQIVKYKELPQKVENIKTASPIKDVKVERKYAPEKLKVEVEIEKKDAPIIVEAAKDEKVEDIEKQETEKEEKKKIDLNELDKKIDELLENVDG